MDGGARGVMMMNARIDIVRAPGRLLALILCLGTLAVGRGEALDESLFEDKALSSSERLWKKTLLTEKLGDDNHRYHIYGGEWLMMNDNIYLVDNDEKSDAIWLTFGGLDLRFEQEDRYKLIIAGDYSRWNFEDYDREDHTRYDFRPSLEYEFNSLLAMSLGGEFSKTASPVEETGDGRLQRHRNGGNLGFEITPAERWGVNLNWDVADTQYRQGADKRLEHAQSTLQAAPYYLVSEKARLGLQLSYGWTEREHKILNEAGWIDCRGAVTYAPGERWRFHLAAGYQSRDYDTSGTVGDRSDFGGLVYSGAVRYEPFENWRFALSVLRTPEESSNGNFFILNRYAGKATWIPIAPLKLSAEIFGNHVDDSWSADSERYGLCLEGTWSFTQWAGCGMGYQYADKDSDAARGDYTNNIFSLGAWLMF